MRNAGDIIDFEGKKFIVLTSFSCDGKGYSFINETFEENDDVSDVYYVIEYRFDGTYDKVTDQEVLDKIYPTLQQNLRKEMEDNGLDVEALIRAANEGEN